MPQVNDVSYSEIDTREQSLEGEASTPTRGWIDSPGLTTVQ